MSGITGFKKINAALFLANAKPELFIGKEWAVTPRQEEACAVETLFDSILTYITNNRLTTQTGLPRADADIFLKNIRTFTANHAQGVLPRKLIQIERLLKNEPHTQDLLLQYYLSKPTRSEPKDKLFHLTLSCMDFERRLLQGLVSALSAQDQCEQLMLQGLEKGLSIVPETFEEFPVKWQGMIDLPRLEPLKNIVPEDFTDPARLRNAIGLLLYCKQNYPEASEVLDNALMSIQVHEQIDSSDAVLSDSNKSIKVTTRLVDNPENAYDSYDLCPLLEPIIQFSRNYFDETAKATQSYVHSLFENDAPFADPQAISRDLLRIENGLTQEYLSQTKEVLAVYLEQAEKTKALYLQVYKRLSTPGQTLTLPNLYYLKETPDLPLPRNFHPENVSIPIPALTLVETLSRQPFDERDYDLDLVKITSSSNQASSSCDVSPAPSLALPTIRWVDIAKKGASSPTIRPLGESARQMQQFTEYFERHFPTEGSFSPTGGLELTEPLKAILHMHLEFNPHRSFVAARDIASGRYIVAMSLRMFSLNPLAKQQTLLQKEGLEPHQFAEMEMDRSMAQLLHKAMVAYYGERSFSADELQKTFGAYLARLFEQTKTPERMIERLKVLRSLYSEALTKEEWNALKALCQVKVPTKEEVFEIVCQKTSREATLMMPIVNLTCGEGKIALDCIRRTRKASMEEKAMLPRSLSERFVFAAVRSTSQQTDALELSHLTNAIERIDHIGQFEVAVMNVCNKCRKIWPALEALYWSSLQ